MKAKKKKKQESRSKVTKIGFIERKTYGKKDII